MRFFAPRPSLRLRYVAGVLLAVIGLFAVSLSSLLSAQSIPQAVRNAACSAARLPDRRREHRGHLSQHAQRTRRRFRYRDQTDPDDVVQAPASATTASGCRCARSTEMRQAGLPREFIRLASDEQETDAEPAPAERERGMEETFVLLPTPTPTPTAHPGRRKAALSELATPAAAPTVTPTAIAA